MGDYDLKGASGRRDQAHVVHRSTKMFVSEDHRSPRVRAMRRRVLSLRFQGARLSRSTRARPRRRRGPRMVVLFFIWQYVPQVYYSDQRTKARIEERSCTMKAKTLVGAGLALILTVAASAQMVPPRDPAGSALLDAVLQSDRAKVKDLLAQGAPADAKDRDDRTALFFAAEKGDLETVQLLLDHGANVAAVEKRHGERPVGAAARAGHPQVVRLLLARDDSLAAVVALNAVYQDNAAVLDAATATGRLIAEDLSCALELAERQGSSEIVAHLRQSGVPSVAHGTAANGPEKLAALVGRYRSDACSSVIEVSLKDGHLTASEGHSPIRLAVLEPAYFTTAEGPVVLRLRFDVVGGRAVGVTRRYIGEGCSFRKVEEAKP